MLFWLARALVHRLSQNEHQHRQISKCNHYLGSHESGSFDCVCALASASASTRRAPKRTRPGRSCLQSERRKLTKAIAVAWQLAGRPAGGGKLFDGLHRRGRAGKRREFSDTYVHIGIIAHTLNAVNNISY